VSFGVPTESELAHDYLWRIHLNCPVRGEIGIFNRSHYPGATVRRREARGLERSEADELEQPVHADAQPRVAVEEEQQPEGHQQEPADDANHLVLVA
jgi:polyphosphate kinase 2 (PPK2 family)